MPDTSNGSAPGLSFIVPAYNEEGAIIPTLERLKAVLGTLDLANELIVVNDGSTDATAERALGVDGVHVVSHPINTGYGSAIKTGILTAKYEWIGIVDADGTYDIERLPELVEKMQAGFEVAIAVRENVSETDRFFKRLSRKVLVTFISVWVSGKIKDPNSGFRVFTKEFAMTFFPFLCDTFSFTTSSTIFATGEGYFIAHIPMEYKPRVGKSKVRHFRDSLRMMQLILQGITFFNPLKFFIILALMLVLGVLVPGFILELAGLPRLAETYVVAGVMSCLLFGLGVIGDIIRVASVNRTGKNRVFAKRVKG